jgi:hypothetical protein
MTIESSAEALPTDVAKNIIVNGLAGAAGFFLSPVALTLAVNAPRSREDLRLMCDPHNRKISAALLFTAGAMGLFAATAPKEAVKSAAEGVMTGVSCIVLPYIVRAFRNGY